VKPEAFDESSKFTGNDGDAAAKKEAMGMMREDEATKEVETAETSIIS